MHIAIAVLVLVCAVPVIFHGYRRQADRYSGRKAQSDSVESRLTPSSIAESNFGDKVPRYIQRDS